MDVPFFILASASPRRQLLLTQAGYCFEVDPSDVDEPEPPPGTTVFDYVTQLAWKKARAVAVRRGIGLILAADTSCSVEGQILNKPADRDDAERMIRLQEGRDTEVVTGICLYRADRHDWAGATEVSLVRFRALGDDERTEYLNSDRWEGKAGAYGLQDDDPWITVVSGTWSNVVGLPMDRLERLFRDHPGLTTGP